MLTGCVKHTLFTRLDDQRTGIHFSNDIRESKSFNVLSYPYIYNGGGVGVGDMNGDGLKDIFFAGNMVSCRLYLNRGNWRFEDVTEKAGLLTKDWCTGVAIVDINGDGLADIHVCTVNPEYGHFSRNHFFINQGVDKDGVPHFKDMAATMRLDDEAFSTQAAFLDYDGDGDLDMYLLVNGNVNYNRNEARPVVGDGSDPATGRLYRNDGIPAGGTVPVFTNVSRQAGILQQGWGLGVTVCDINKDNWPDIYVSNDFLSNDQMLINNHDGTFTNEIARRLRHQSQNSMGVDVGDINNDGLPDIVTVDMKPFDNVRDKSMFGRQNYDLFQLQLAAGYQPEYVRNSLQLNNGNGTFSEIGQMAGVYATDWSWSALLADLDNDGYRDLFISNGYGKDVTDLDYLNYMSNGANNLFGSDSVKRQRAYDQMVIMKDVSLPSFVFHNDHDLRFSNKSAEWGFDVPSLSNGAAYADLDNDGDLDLVVNNLDREAYIYRNDLVPASANHWLEVELHQPGMNREALGAKVEIFSKRLYQYADLTRQRGFMSSVDNQLHFGLGSLSSVDSLRVTWPDGSRQILPRMETNRVVKIEKSIAPGREAAAVKEADGAKGIYEEARGLGILYKHEEDGYVDFKTEPLVPYQYSRCGPGIAVGDVNGDGLDDVFFGGAADHGNSIFLQRPDGGFYRQVFEASKPFEDMGAIFFDADGDGDLDLYVVSGGNAYPAGSPDYMDRLYLNDGKGHFRRDTLALPELYSPGSVVVAADIDGDGDLDLFVGAKAEPHRYPIPGQSRLLRNDHGRFTDVTKEWAPGLERAGIINSAIFSDFDNDGQPDLVLAGEWMPVRFFHNQRGHFIDVTVDSGIGDKLGWWNSLVAVDMDGDGDMDYIAGNMGLNTRYAASVNEPVSIYAKDFNDDGFIDPVMTYYLHGKEVTDAYRDDLIKQVIGVRRRFPYYSDFGKADFGKIFTPKELEGAYIRRCTWMYNSYIENKGGGRFVMSPLPNLAQVAPVYGMAMEDVDGDERPDIIMTGNQYAASTLTGRYDAFNGLVLRSNGKGSFNPMTVSCSGFFDAGDGKGLAIVRSGSGSNLLMVTNNDDSVRVFRKRGEQGGAGISFLPLDRTALIHYSDGHIQKLEPGYGSGYLSQSSRWLRWTEKMDWVEITDGVGKIRKYFKSSAKNK
jgi:hypothetical protein